MFMRKFFVSLGFLAAFSSLSHTSFAGGGTAYVQKVPTFTLDQAILTALQRNPALLNGEQEIKRTRGVIIQIRAEVLPQVTARANFEWVDPHLQGARIWGSTTGWNPPPRAPTGATSFLKSPSSRVGKFHPPLAAPTPFPIQNVEAS